MHVIIPFSFLLFPVTSQLFVIEYRQHSLKRTRLGLVGNNVCLKNVSRELLVVTTYLYICLYSLLCLFWSQLCLTHTCEKEIQMPSHFHNTFRCFRIKTQPLYFSINQTDIFESQIVKFFVVEQLTWKSRILDSSGQLSFFLSHLRHQTDGPAGFFIQVTRKQ